MARADIRKTRLLGGNYECGTSRVSCAVQGGRTWSGGWSRQADLSHRFKRLAGGARSASLKKLAEGYGAYEKTVAAVTAPRDVEARPVNSANIGSQSDRNWCTPMKTRTILWS